LAYCGKFDLEAQSNQVIINAMMASATTAEITNAYVITFMAD